MKSDHFKKEIEWLLREKYQGEKTNELEKDIERLKAGEPLDHIIGSTPFLGCTIDLSFKPLIPRTETEFWVEKALKDIEQKEKEKPVKILDLFSGSGCIGIALLKHLHNSTVDLGEHDQKLLSQISKNIEKNNIEKHRSYVFETDCFNNVPHKKYDYIFANPPYISEHRLCDIQPSVKQYEPHKALFAPDNGLFFVKKLISESDQYLKPGGMLYIEFDTFQKETIEAYIPENKYDLSFWKDQFDNWRVVILTKKEL